MGYWWIKQWRRTSSDSLSLPWRLLSKFIQSHLWITIFPIKTTIKWDIHRFWGTLMLGRYAHYLSILLHPIFLQTYGHQTHFSTKPSKHIPFCHPQNPWLTGCLIHIPSILGKVVIPKKHQVLKKKHVIPNEPSFKSLILQNLLISSGKHTKNDGTSENHHAIKMGKSTISQLFRLDQAG